MDKDLIEKLDDRFNEIKYLIERLERKIDNLEKKVDGDLLTECKKMGSHIDFVENVYDNVKNPLGFICRKMNNFVGTEKKYSLTSKNLEEDEQEPDE